jgi:hypothetical protein
VIFADAPIVTLPMLSIRLLYCQFGATLKRQLPNCRPSKCPFPNFMSTSFINAP